MRAWLLLLLALVVPSVAHADPRRVMAYGDSTTRGDLFRAHESWPAVLGALRPDLVVVNEGKAGDTSENMPRFFDALDAHAPDVVLLMLGTNDAVCDVADPVCLPTIATPARSLRNLQRMVLHARRRGAEVFVLTQTPSAWIFGPYCDANPDAFSCPDRVRLEAEFTLRQTHTRQVAEGIVAWRRRRNIRVLNLRDEFTTRNWVALSPDGLHLNSAGNRVIAEYLARVLP